MSFAGSFLSYLFLIPDPGQNSGLPRLILLAISSIFSPLLFDSQMRSFSGAPKFSERLLLHLFLSSWFQSSCFMFEKAFQEEKMIVWGC